MPTDSHCAHIVDTNLNELTPVNALGMKPHTLKRLSTADKFNCTLLLLQSSKILSQSSYVILGLFIMGPRVVPAVGNHRKNCYNNNCLSPNPLPGGHFIFIQFILTLSWSIQVGNIYFYIIQEVKITFIYLNFFFQCNFLNFFRSLKKIF